MEKLYDVSKVMTMEQRTKAKESEDRHSKRRIEQGKRDTYVR